LQAEWEGVNVCLASKKYFGDSGAWKDGKGGKRVGKRAEKATKEDEKELKRRPMRRKKSRKDGQRG